MREYSYISLSEVIVYEPQIKSLNIDDIILSSEGFLAHYKEVDGKRNKVSETWKKKRRAYIRKHLPQYRKNPTLKLRLSLIGWAYNPDKH
jgi:hypothetical protein